MGQPLVDLARLDLDHAALAEEEIRRLLPHRHEFQLIDRICWLDPAGKAIAGCKDWGADPWWARGHIPGRPLLPGVLMVEGAAQAASILMKKTPGGWGPERFIGLAGLEEVRFRGTVSPPCRVVFVAAVGAQTSRIARYPCQCFAGGRLVMEMQLLGVPL
jgi:3-hydroxyacyl-[acyl-carrier-protein] dehydratase